MKKMRVVICTSALGCGVNCNGIQYVLHFGLPFTLVEYCQQIGRAGRSGEANCHAILYNYPQSGRNQSNDIKYHSYSVSCLRFSLYSPFNVSFDSISPLQPKHLCCSICAVACNCGSKYCIEANPFEINTEESLQIPTVVRNVLETDESTVEELLNQFYMETVTSPTTIPSAFISGLTGAIINDIVKDLAYISSPQYILDNFPIVDEWLAENIYNIIKIHFKEEHCLLPEKIKTELPEQQQFEFGDFLLDEENDNVY